MSMFKRESSGNRSTTSTIRQILSAFMYITTIVAFRISFFIHNQHLWKYMNGAEENEKRS